MDKSYWIAINLNGFYKIFGVDFYVNTHSSNLNISLTDRNPGRIWEPENKILCNTVISLPSSSFYTMFCEDGGVAGEYVIIENNGRYPTISFHFYEIMCFGLFIRDTAINHVNILENKLIWSVGHRNSRSSEPLLIDGKFSEVFISTYTEKSWIAIDLLDIYRIYDIAIGCRGPCMNFSLLHNYLNN